MNNFFLSKLGSFFREHLAQMSELSEEDITQAIKDARAHAGGKQKAANKMQMSEAFSNGGEWKLFMEQTFAEPPASIQVLPKAGTYSHPKYGKFTMTPKIIQEFVDNHNNHVYQEQVPIDAEHQSKLSGAIGYYGEMHVIDEGRGGAEANVNWTDRGRELIASDAFQYFSPEWFDEWTNPVGGGKIANVLVGGAITTRPFFKDKAMRPLVAGESYSAGEWDGDGKEEPRTLTMSAMQFSETEPDPDDPNEPNEDEEEAKTKKMKKAADVGDAHVNVPIQKYADEFTEFTPDQRKTLAKSGDAMPDGSYPIRNKSDLSNAVQAYGRSPDEATKSHIKSRAAALGATSMLPDKWTGRKAAVEVDEKTKEFVEAETKKLTEELETERGSRKAAEERLVRLETEAQTRRFTDIIMGHDAAGDGSPPFPGKHEMHNSTLALLAKEYGEDSDQFKEYVGEQRAVAKSMREAGMFKEVGVGSGPSQVAADGAIRRFDEAVSKWQADHVDKSKSDAIQAVATAQPKLYTESIKEKDRIAKSAPTSYGYTEEGE